METFESDGPQYYYTMPKVHYANKLHDSNNYFASIVNSYVDVASNRYIASVNTFVNAPHHTHHNYGYYSQDPMSIINSSSFDVTSNIQYLNLYSSAINSQYVVSPQDMPMNEIICYDNDNYLANYSQNSTPYAKINAHNSASYFAHNHSQISEISARHSSAKTYDLAQHIANNCSRINENSAMVHMQAVMIRFYMLLSNQPESMKI
jgi:hypothetical protein